jgi:ribulose-phosphate 3-epimerase
MLSADFGNLQRDTEMVNHSQADWFHVDIMDGVFVPNISFGFPVVKSLYKHAQKPLDVHLMIVQPERYIKAFKDAGAAVLTIHLEASTHLHRSLDQIRQEGMKAGVALNPHSPVHLLEDIITSCDLVCLMSVNPGFGGQSFIEHTYRKIAQLRSLIQASNSHCLIEIDGGVTLENAPLLLEAGADVLVAGNTVFGAANPGAMIAQLKSCNSAHTKA